MSVHKDTKSNTWYIKYKNQTKRGFRTKTSAQQYEAKLRLQGKEQIFMPYISYIAKDFLYTYKSEVTYGTYCKTSRFIKTIILPNVENKRMNSITELDCRKFKEYVSTLDYSTSYKNCILVTYKMLFKHAIKYFGLINNPTYVIEPFKKSFEEKKKMKEKELNIWTINDFNQFIKYVDKNMYKQMFILLYFTGMRLGECQALTWDDYYDGKLHIDKSITTKTQKNAYEVKETKTYSSIRDIILGETLCNYLDDYKKSEQKLEGFKNEWFIFGRNSPLPQTSIQRIKDNAIKKSGVRRIRLHDFRHSHASNLIADGVNIVAVSKRLGHSDINMTLKIYTHLLKKSEEELAEYLNKSSQNLLTK